MEEITRLSVGHTVTFRCTDQLTDAPADWWIHNGTAHQITSGTHVINSFKTSGRFSLRKAFSGDWSLIVNNLKLSDSGVYICRTEHGDQRIRLTVLCKYKYFKKISGVKKRKTFCEFIGESLLHKYYHSVQLKSADVFLIIFVCPQLIRAKSFMFKLVIEPY